MKQIRRTTGTVRSSFPAHPRVTASPCREEILPPSASTNHDARLRSVRLQGRYCENAPSDSPPVAHVRRLSGRGRTRANPPASPPTPPCPPPAPGPACRPRPTRPPPAATAERESASRLDQQRRRRKPPDRRSPSGIVWCPSLVNWFRFGFSRRIISSFVPTRARRAA